MFIRKYYFHTEYLNDSLQCHRLNYPAIECPNGTIKYIQNNLLHNPNGPAIIWSTGVEEYYLYGVQIQKEDINHPISYLKLKYDLCL